MYILFFFFLESFFDGPLIESLLGRGLEGGDGELVLVADGGEFKHGVADGAGAPVEPRFRLGVLVAFAVARIAADQVNRSSGALVVLLSDTAALGDGPGQLEGVDVAGKDEVDLLVVEETLDLQLEDVAEEAALELIAGAVQGAVERGDEPGILG